MKWQWTKRNYLRLITIVTVAAAIFFSGGENTPMAEPVHAKAEPAAKEPPIAVSAQDYGDQSHFIRIHKLSYKLEVFEKGKPEPIRTYDCAVGKNIGDKQRTGDMTTPVSWGDVLESAAGAEPKTPSTKIPFLVEEICYAEHWSHDFNDGKGVINGAYGPWFISLNTGWDGIGIHGTHDPASIGTKATEGCIRLRNENIDELKNILEADKGGIGVRVVITED